ncbi:MAG: invasion associated locus B family protein [Pseudomonadota bacterium]
MPRLARIERPQQTSNRETLEQRPTDMMDPSLSRPLCTLTRAAATTVLALACAAPSAAQQTDTTTGVELDMGTPTDSAEDGLGETYILEVTGDWAVSCVRTTLEHDPCGLIQQLNDQSDNPVARIRLVNLPGDGQAAAGANIVTPLETLLSRQITLSVDGGVERRYGFTYCTQASCVANVGFTEAEVDQFRRGSAAQLTIFSLQAPDQPVTLSASLSGFTAGYARITELNALNAEAVAAARAAQAEEGADGVEEGAATE